MGGGGGGGGGICAAIVKQGQTNVGCVTAPSNNFNLYACKVYI